MRIGKRSGLFRTGITKESGAPEVFLVVAKKI